MKLPVKTLCKKAGMSRQNFYKAREIRQRKKVDEELIKTLVESERKIQPRIGGLKLYKVLRPELDAAGIKIGRDRFFEVLRSQGLVLEALPKAPQTTNSRHNLPVFGNLVKEMQITAPNQVWVSDITYIRTQADFMYLSLITDMYSRKVVGYHLSTTLEAQDSIKALEMALNKLPENSFPIHHSDRGSQYCSHEYINRLQSRGLPVSMTENNHCAENALAERMNGILKQEYYLKETFRTKRQAREAVDEAINLYNTRRLHRSLELQTPEQVHNAAA